MRALGSVWALALVLASGCSASHPGPAECRTYEPPCPPGSVEWTDEHCFDNDASPEESCMPRGDGLCYQLCRTEDDCADPCRPHCAELGFFASGTSPCGPPGYRVRVCKESLRGACEL